MEITEGIIGSNASPNIKAEDVKSKEQLNRMDKIELFDEASSMFDRIKKLEVSLSQAEERNVHLKNVLAAVYGHIEVLLSM